MQTIQFVFYRLSGKPSSFELPSDFDGVKLNFLEAKPESNVQDVYNASEKLITEAQEALENLKNYKGKPIWSYLPNIKLSDNNKPKSDFSKRFTDHFNEEV